MASSDVGAMRHNWTPAAATEVAAEFTEVILTPLDGEEVPRRMTADRDRGARPLRLLGGTVIATLVIGAGLVMLEGDPGREASVELQYDDQTPQFSTSIPANESSVAAAEHDNERNVETSTASRDAVDEALVEDWTGAIARAFVSGWARGQSPLGHLGWCRLAHRYATHVTYRCISKGHADSTRQIIDQNWTFSVEHNISISLRDGSAHSVSARSEDPRQERLDAFHVWLFLAAEVVPLGHECLARLTIDPTCQRAATDPANAAAWIATNPAELAPPDMAVDPLVFS